MRNGRIDPREHWTAEARAVAYEYHRYQTGAGEGKHTSGRAAGQGDFGQERGRGHGSAEEARSYGQHNIGQENTISKQNQQPTQPLPAKPRVPQGPRATEFRHSPNSSTPPLPAIPYRGPKFPAYEPPQYHWTPPSSGNPSNLQSPIHFNQRIFDPAGEVVSGTFFPPYTKQDPQQTAGFAKYSVGYLPPPPPPLNTLADPTSVLAYQTNYSPVTPFQAMLNLPPTSPKSPKQLIPPAPSPSLEIRPSSKRHFKVSDLDFHGYHTQGPRSRYSQSEPPCTSDLKSMADLLEQDSDMKTGAGGTVQKDEAKKGPGNQALNRLVIVSSAMSRDL
jgi:hypothetical protein